MKFKEEKVNERETITPAEIAKRLNRGTDQIQAALRNGEFPEFGKAIKGDGGRWAYICSRAAFENWMAHGAAKIVQEIHIAKEDFETLAKAILAG
jgi:hypothetical protein